MLKSSPVWPLIEVDPSSSDAVRLDALDHRYISERARLSELRGWRMTEDEGGVDIADACKFEWGALVLEDIDRSEIDIDSSIMEGDSNFWPPATYSCCNCCCWVRITCNKRFCN